MRIRQAEQEDKAAIWRILEPMIREGETYPLAPDMTEWEALDYWFAGAHRVYVAEEEDGTLLGTYYLRANQPGQGAHVANCGYITAREARGKGIARAMCLHSFEEAKRLGFRAMQYNLVVATNAPALHLWQSCGMEITGRLKAAFRHPKEGYVDAFVMYREL
ncbi:N-acetyltransferase family protein [Tepidicaulis sp. LMO-SS28]|uniref:GNAT family N-acetyltransferase n=1 Tax=Tepidicaulis sp. LMO-SS28 TaxID=3447455 RepID=UPI003EE346FC